MAQDLISLVMQQLGPSITDRLSAMTGVSRDSTQKTMGGAVPAMLAALVGIVSRPGGGDRLAASVKQLDPGMIDNIMRPTGEGVPQDVVVKGQSMLTSLFGNQGAEGLTGAIAKYAGLDQGVSGTLLGFLTPLIMGVLGRQQASAGSGGLAEMLLSQKDAIASALPPGLASTLQGTGLLSGIADRLGQGAATATDTVGGAAKSALGDLGPKPARPPPAPSPLAKATARQLPLWWIGAAAIALLALIAYWLSSQPQVQQAARPPAETGAPPAGSGTSTMVAATELGRQFTGTLDGVRQTLQGVSDVASAQQALPRLNDAVSQLDKLRSLAGQASPDDRKALADMIGKVRPQMQGLIDQVLKVPGVSDVLKPTLDTLGTKLNDLASA